MAKRQQQKHRKDQSLPAVDNAADPQPAQPSTDDQSGSTGRPTSGQVGEGGNSGQGHYGQSGFAGKVDEDSAPARPDRGKK